MLRGWLSVRLDTASARPPPAARFELTRYLKSRSTAARAPHPISGAKGRRVPSHGAVNANAEMESRP
jgi:hypothetical protein